MDIEAILFDMDGVLVDVSRSYRMAIKKTAEFFSDTVVNFAEISAFKNKGGYNNDWDLTEAILVARQIAVNKQTIIDKFQQFYLGQNQNGFILNENWLLDLKLLDDLNSQFLTGIVTGRPRAEADFVLNRFAVHTKFNIIVALEDTPPGRRKPNPFGINNALKQLQCHKAIYVGDTIDDMKAARAAGITAIGIVNKLDEQHAVREQLKINGACYVFNDVNQITEILK